MIHLRVKDHTELADETLYVRLTLALRFSLISGRYCSVRMDEHGHIRPPNAVEAQSREREPQDWTY